MSVNNEMTFIVYEERLKRQRAGYGRSKFKVVLTDNLMGRYGKLESNWAPSVSQAFMSFAHKHIL